MNTIGQTLKTARLKKGISLRKLENTTKIKKEFIVFLENSDWDSLPEYPVVSGFVKNIAHALDLSVDNTLAVLRRDYPPIKVNKVNINPKPDVEKKFTWSPKLTFALGVGLIILLVLGYLASEYYKFIQPPEVTIFEPKENQVLFLNNVQVSGKTTTDVTLTINNQPIILDQDGGFNINLEVNKDTKELKFRAVSRSGKVTEKVINIKVE